MAEQSIPLASSLSPFVDSGALAGAVIAVASKERVLSLEAIGCADLASRRPMRCDDLFWIASMTKPLVATLMMMLVEEGKVDLDAPVETYLPEFKGQMVEVQRDELHVLLQPLHRSVLVADVLRHTSGLPFLSRLEPKIDLLSLRECALAAAMTNLNWQPGTKYLYSNAGTNVAGRIIEVVSGMPYERFMQERLLEPLEMHDTTFWPTELQLTKLAKAYQPNEEKTELLEIPISQLTYPLYDRSRHANPAGGLFSTASDFTNYCRMILNRGTYQGRKFLSPASIRKMTTTQTGDLTVPGSQPGSGYGFCWSTPGRDPGNTDDPLIGRCGHAGALSTQFWLHPQHGLATLYLVQHQGYLGPDGDKIYPAFEEGAIGLFGNASV